MKTLIPLIRKANKEFKGKWRIPYLWKIKGVFFSFKTVIICVVLCRDKYSGDHLCPPLWQRLSHQGADTTWEREGCPNLLGAALFSFLLFIWGSIFFVGSFEQIAHMNHGFPIDGKVVDEKKREWVKQTITSVSESNKELDNSGSTGNWMGRLVV